MGRIMLKGLITIHYMLYFVGEIALALILVYLMLYGGFGIAKSLASYDARSNVETLAGILSAVSSHTGSFRLTYSLPNRECKLEITQNKIKMTFPSTTVKIESGSQIKLSQGEGELFIAKPDYVKIKPLSTSCSSTSKKTILIYKEGNDVELIE